MQNKDKKKKVNESEVLREVAELIDLCAALPQSEIPQRPLNEMKRDFVRLLSLRLGTQVARAVMYSMVLLLALNCVRQFMADKVDATNGTIYLAVEFIAGMIYMLLERQKATPAQRIADSLDSLSPFIAQYCKSRQNQK